MNYFHGKIIIGVLYKRKGNLGYGECSQYLAYCIESQGAGFGIEGSVVESSFR